METIVKELKDILDMRLTADLEILDEQLVNMERIGLNPDNYEKYKQISKVFLDLVKLNADIRILDTM